MNYRQPFTHRVTAVVHDPVVPQEGNELYEFEVNAWYETFDMLVSLYQRRHPERAHLRGLDHLEVRAMSMLKIES